MNITERIRTLEEYTGRTICPDDFVRRWREKLEAMGALELHREQVEFHNPMGVYERLRLTLPTGEIVSGRYLRPVGAGPFPTLFMFHDLGRPCRGWHHMTRFIGLGYAVAALENSDNLPDEITSFTEHELEHSFCAALAISKAVLEFSETDKGKLAAWGEGFGGGLAVAVSALLPQPVRCACLHPMPTELAAEKGMWDIENFAPLLHAPLLLGTALMDQVAPPEGQYALYNRADCLKRHLVYPKYEHERINDFENEHIKFLHQAAWGIT